MIDQDFIFKKINNSLSEEENAVFNNWLKEKPEHRNFYYSARKYLKDNEQSGNKPVNILSGWVKVKSKIDRPGKNYLRLILVSAIAASIIGVLFLVFPEKQMSPDDNFTDKNIQFIQAGTNRAILMLDDGTLYNLNEDNTLVLAEGNSLIESAGEKIKYQKKTSDRASENKKVKFNSIMIPRGGQFFVELSDGTQVWLNSGSTLRYPVHFEEGGRHVELSGEAFFSVAPDIKSPFHVSTGIKVIRVLGTEFNISSYAEDSVISTTLVSGKLEICTKDNAETLMVLEPNEQCRFNKSEENFSRHEVDILPYVAWKDGRFIFINQPLQQIMKTLSRWYDIEIVFQNNNVKNISFTGNLERYTNLEDILHIIKKTNEMEFLYIVDSNTIIVK